MKYSVELRNKVISYYQKYYQQFGFRDYEIKAQSRLNEEEVEEKKIDFLKTIIRDDFAVDQKHLIIGVGTGGLAVVLRQKYHGQVFGVEPCREELDIISGKCREVGMDSNNFTQGKGEKLIFADNFFDFVYCLNVLEHVENIEDCLNEMIRVLKPGGWIYITTPNYNFPVERHYKIVFPVFLPRWAGYLYLILIGKPWTFLKTVNYITNRQIDKILDQQKKIFWMRIFKPSEKYYGRLSWLVNFFRVKLLVYPNQEIIIKKNTDDK